MNDTHARQRPRFEATRKVAGESLSIASPDFGNPRPWLAAPATTRANTAVFPRLSGSPLERLATAQTFASSRPARHSAVKLENPKFGIPCKLRLSSARPSATSCWPSY